MFDISLVKELTEIISKSLNYKDIEGLGRYFFKDYSSHKLNRMPETQTVSNSLAARTVVNLCFENGKIEDFSKFLIELDGTSFNGKVVKLNGIEDFLNALSKRGICYDYKTRKFTEITADTKRMCNWGSLISGKDYQMIIASIDICSSSELVKKYKQDIIEKVYSKLWEYAYNKLDKYEGRIWSWAGDGGIIAFRADCGINEAVCCLLEILFALPVFNGWQTKPIDDDIKIRLGVNMGSVKFYEDTGRIVSDIINFASHLEKRFTGANSISVTDDIYEMLNPNIRKLFKNGKAFDGKKIYAINYDYLKFFK